MDQATGMIPSAEDVLASYHLPPVKPLWLNANYAKHIVKGNFLTLSAKPKTVEMGEWVAHQGMRSSDEVYERRAADFPSPSC